MKSSEIRVQQGVGVIKLFVRTKKPIDVAIRQTSESQRALSVPDPEHRLVPRGTPRPDERPLRDMVLDEQ